MPSTIAGPELLIDPPLAFTPLTIVNSRAVLYSHRTLPSRVEYARSRPSIVPENAAPGINVTAAACDGSQGFLLAQPAPGTLHTRRPVPSSTASMPPPAPWSAAT